ncbi:myosin-1-like [Typha angustifolia]|uniref:myosin-1-like n=1 Tax=Typha angustifolia TaxID=59011 RepID=UPI003C300BD4
MSSAATMSPMMVRSSMELMLDAIRQRDEKPKDLPPALPARPTSRGRLPTSRRSLLGPGSKFETNAPKSLLMENKAVVLESRILGSMSMAKVEQQPDENPYPKIPELESFEGRVEEATSMEILLDEKLESKDHAREKVTASEDARSRTFQEILRIQKYFRGFHARRGYHELLKGATTLQSFVRGERARLKFDCQMKRWRAAVLIQKHVRLWIAREVSDNQRKDIILLQSVIRGCLVRNQFMPHETSKLTDMKIYPDPGSNNSIKETNKDNDEVCSSVLAQLQMQVLKAEVALRQKEDENAVLQQQLQQYKQKCSEYEVKMKPMEEAEVALQQKEDENAILQQQLQQYKQKCSEYEVKMKPMEEAEVALQQKEDENAILQQQLQQYKQKCSECEIKMKPMEEAEVALQKKEEENAILQEQLQQHKQIWSDYEAKMKSMEETWQKQLTALQVSLAAAKRTLSSDDWVSQRGISRIHHHYDSDDTFSTETRTSEDTPAKQNHISDAGIVSAIDGKHNAVGYLVKEFEQRSQVFEDCAGFLIAVKSGQSASKIKPDEEFQKLKARFSAWKKDYKVRLRETKTALQKLASPEEKPRKRWWSRRSTK